MFLPTKSIELYIIGTTLAVTALYAKVSFRIISFHWVIFATLIFFYFSASIRLFVGMPVIRDYLEFAKFLGPIIILAYPLAFQKFGIEDVLKAFLIFIIVDATFVIIDLLSLAPNITSVVETYYQSDAHVESVRSVGLGQGPSQHGIIIAFSFLSFFINIVIGNQYKLLSCVGLLIAVPLLLAVQSQTTLVSLVFSIMALVISILFFKNRNFINKKVIRRRVLVISASIFALAGVLIFYFQEYISYLMLLFEYGLDRNSYLERIEKTNYLTSLALEAPQWIFFGWGLEYFGDYSQSMDNGYLYMVLVFGILPSLLFLVLLIKFLISILYSKNGNLSDYFSAYLFSILMFGLPFNWPSNFFLKPNVMILLSLFTAIVYARKFIDKRQPLIFEKSK